MKKIIQGFFCVAVFLGFFAINSYAQNEQLIITTYYPSPSGSYNELGVDKLAVNVSGDPLGNVVAIGTEFAAMGIGDAHIGWSMIVGSGGGSGWAYDEMTTAGETMPGDGDVRIKGDLGLGMREPRAKLEILDTTTQLRLSNVYDSAVPANDHFVDFLVDDNSDLIVTPEGTGRVVLQPTTDSTDFFQVMDADGGTSVLNVDSTNERVGIGTDGPGSMLHVANNIAGVAVVPGGILAANTVSLWVENTANPSYGIYATTTGGAPIYSNTGDGNALAAVNDSNNFNTIYAQNLGGSMPAIYAEGAQARSGSAGAGGQGTHRQERRVPHLLSFPARS